MITKRGVLVVLALIGFVVGLALAVALWLGPTGLYAARRAQIYDEPARALFVSGAIALAAIPLLGALACGVFRLAGASAPVRRGLTAWGVSIVLAIPTLVAVFVLSMVLPTPDASSAYYAGVALYAGVCAVIWVIVARRPFAAPARLDRTQIF